MLKWNYILILIFVIFAINLVSAGATYVLPETSIYGDAITGNLEIEANFSHLSIDNTTSPYSSLLVYYNFDINNENVSYDLSSHNEDGIFYRGANTTNEGFIGQGAKFNTTNYFQGPNIIDADNVSELTVSAWFKMNSGTGGTIVSKYRAGFGTWYIQWAQSSRTIQCRMFNASNTAPFVNSQTYPAGSNPGNDKRWHHVACMKNQTHLNLYVDGIFNSSTALTGLLANRNENICIGGEAGNSNICTVNSLSLNGTVDEVMIFNASLTSAEILSIYQNQSIRFYNQGTFNLSSQSGNYLNITSGENKVNVSTNFNRYKDTNISLSLNYYDGSWHSTEFQNLSDINTYTITSGTTNLTLNFTFLSTDNTVPFYTPNLISDINLTTWSEAAANTCTYNSGNWNILCSDGCNITTNVNLNGNNITITGTGVFKLDGGNITNWKNKFVSGTDSTNICRVLRINGGGFRG